MKHGPIYAYTEDRTVSRINSDFSTGVDLTGTYPQAENKGATFQGVKQNGPFEVEPPTARKMLLSPLNPDGSHNSKVVKRFVVNDDVTMRDSDSWIIDFTDLQTIEQAALHQAPFEKVKRDVTKFRDSLAKGSATEISKLDRFWLMQRPRTKLRSAIKKLKRVITVPETSEHLIFRFLPSDCTFSGSVFVIARDDYPSFGVLQSSFHKLWAAQKGNDLGVGDQNRYNSTATFETFPFPDGLTPNILAEDYADDPRAKAIATAAARLNELRENWLNPAELVKRVPEVVPGYPERILPVDDNAAKILKKRTLTNLYNERPTWLAHVHRDLDRAVAAAYGWEEDFEAGTLTDEEILKRLFELNQARAAEQAT